MKRVGAGVAVIVVALSLMTPPATSQNSSAWLTPKAPEPLERAGKVVLTVSMWRAGRVMYRTFDGLCNVGFSPGATPADAACSDERKARAPADYTATSGELVFAQGGSKQITIPIVDDGLAEGDEAFTVAAWEDANADPWLPRGDSVIVHIADDETDPSGEDVAAPEAGSSTSTSSAAPAAGPSKTRPAGGSSGSALANPAPTAAKAAGPGATAPALQVALPDGDARPGPGFELTSEGAPEPAAQRRSGARGSASGLAIGSAIAALGVCALAVLWRRRRWSPTQA